MHLFGEICTNYREFFYVDFFEKFTIAVCQSELFLWFITIDCGMSKGWHNFIWKEIPFMNFSWPGNRKLCQSPALWVPYSWRQCLVVYVWIHVSAGHTCGFWHTHCNKVTSWFSHWKSEKATSDSSIPILESILWSHGALNSNEDKCLWAFAECLFILVVQLTCPSLCRKVGDLWSSAVCAFSLAAINKVFDDGKFKEESSFSQWMTYEGEVPDPRPGSVSIASSPLRRVWAGTRWTWASGGECLQNSPPFSPVLELLFFWSRMGVFKVLLSVLFFLEK